MRPPRAPFRIFVPLVLVLPPALAVRTARADLLPAPSPAPSWAAEGSDDGDVYYRKNLFARVFADQASLVTTWWPSQLRHPGLATGLLVPALIAASSPRNGFDVRLESALDRAGGGGANRVAGVFTKLGNAPLYLLGTGVGWLAARHAGNDDLEEASSLSAEALVDAGLWVTVLKDVTRRARPVAVGENGAFFSNAPHFTHSFPSGHAMGAFAVAGVFSRVYAGKPWVRWVAYGTAGLVGASRLTLGRHYPTDVVVGALLGANIGHFVVWRSRGGEDEVAAPHLQPFVDPTRDAAGLVFARRW